MRVGDIVSTIDGGSVGATGDVAVKRTVHHHGSISLFYHCCSSSYTIVAHNATYFCTTTHIGKAIAVDDT